VAGPHVGLEQNQVVPRFGKETGFMEALSGTKVMPETLDQTYKRLMKHKDILKG